MVTDQPVYARRHAHADQHIYYSLKLNLLHAKFPYYSYSVLLQVSRLDCVLHGPVHEILVTFPLCENALG